MLKIQVLRHWGRMDGHGAEGAGRAALLVEIGWGVGVLGDGDDTTDAASVVVGSAAPVDTTVVGVSVVAGAGAIHFVHTVEMDVTVIVEMELVV